MLYKRHLDESWSHYFFRSIHEMHASDAFLLKALLVLFIVSLFGLVIKISTHYMVYAPEVGGTYREGVVGTPRFVNPVLASTRADKDLSMLIFDGLMALDPSGTLVPNIASSIVVSEDGLTYTVTLRDDIYFHDGVKLDTQDVIFTIDLMQNPSLQSPMLANVEGISVERVSDTEFTLTLNEPYALFIQNLTFGILPEHIWGNATIEEIPFSEWNSTPVGTGPYKVRNITYSESGIPEMYHLEPNTEYHKGTPHIPNITFHFFPTEEKMYTAFTEGTIDAVSGIEPEKVSDYVGDKKTHRVEYTPLPKTFALFINQNKSVALRDPSARKALSVALDRATLTESVLHGSGNPIDSPLPFSAQSILSTSTEENYGLERARDILREGGWKVNNESNIWEKNIDGALTPLSFSISTLNTELFDETATILESTWKSLGADIQIKRFEQSDLTQGVIRPRDYETLLFGTHVGRALDYFSFWHSSQRNDPGLNVALYANITTDSILAELRRNQDSTIRDESIQKFAKEIQKETPAIFLFSPQLVSITPIRVTKTAYAGIEDVHERLQGIHTWYIETGALWSFFNKN